MRCPICGLKSGVGRICKYCIEKLRRANEASFTDNTRTHLY
jgi:hypothetical protein